MDQQEAEYEASMNAKAEQEQAMQEQEGNAASVQSDRQPIELTCVNGHKFIFTVEEQEFFASHSPAWPPPIRCIPCRRENKAKKSRKDYKKTFFRK